METLETFEKRIRRSNNRRLILSVVITTLLISFSMLYKFGSVQSESMLPSLVVGDCVLYTTATNFNKIDIGDIILYQANNGRIVIHRVINSEQILDNAGKWVKQYIVQGDNNATPDSTHVNKDNFKGKVVHIIKWKALSRYIYELTSQDSLVRAGAVRNGMLIIVVIAGTLFILSLIRDNRIDKRRKEIVNYYGLAENKENIQENVCVESNVSEDNTTAKEHDIDIIKEMDALSRAEEPTVVNITASLAEVTAQKSPINNITKNKTTIAKTKPTSVSNTSVDKKAVLIACGISVAIIASTLIFKYLKERS